jgi:hypothetical protein
VTIARALIAKKKELIKLELEELELEQRESDRASMSSHGRRQNSNSNQTVATEVGAVVFNSFNTESALTGFNVQRLQKSLASVQEDSGAAQAAVRPPSVSAPLEPASNFPANRELSPAADPQEDILPYVNGSSVASLGNWYDATEDLAATTAKYRKL